jgi:2,3-bisphosphoglycerate-dependent phosphoglycerate mutase
MGKLVILRHGESVWNKKGVFTGWVNIGLSEKGVKEALEAGEKMKDIAFDAIYVSSLVITQTTVAIVLAKNRVTKTAIFKGPSKWEKSYGESDFIEVIETEALNERYYGLLQGKNKEDVKKEFGEEQFLLWRRSYDTAPPEGESLKMTIERALPYCEKEIFPRVRKGETVLVCAHGNSIRGIIMHLNRLSSKEVVKLEIPTGEPIIYDLS